VVNAAPTNARLRYFGGPVLSSVKVQTVFWNSRVQFQSDLNQFYTEVTQSPYFDWLTEYNTPDQTIGEGSFIGTVTDSHAPTGRTIDDSAIQRELSRLISANTVSAPDENTLYMIHFPAGVTITQGGDSSCDVFCAYHNTMTIGGQDIQYGVIPDQGGACDGGCGTAGNLTDDTTMVSSHELIEAVTDPAVGLVPGNTPVAPIAWIDATNGEIGDICVGQQGSAQGSSRTWVVQQEWSNSAGSCISSK
jgi:hypothetical protein